MYTPTTKTISAKLILIILSWHILVSFWDNSFMDIYLALDLPPLLFKKNICSFIMGVTPLSVTV